jgi:hypothetical protein
MLDMNNKKFKLIEGVYQEHEISEILAKLFSDKIKHHNVKILNFRETGEGDILKSENRVKELFNTKKEISEYLKSFKGKRVEVKSYVEITVIED